MKVEITRLLPVSRKNKTPTSCLDWDPQGEKKRERGRPLGIWRSTVWEEQKEARKTWFEVSQLA